MSETKNYFRDVTELDMTEEQILARMKREQPAFSEEELSGVSRRHFIQLLGASAALASAAGCRWEEDHMLPFNEQPQNRLPGVPQHFATAMELNGVAAPLLATCYDGRPIKLEGNPGHPQSKGAANVAAQASILGMYDPARSRFVVRKSGAETIHQKWDDFVEQSRPLFAKLRGVQGQGLRILSQNVGSPSLTDMKGRLKLALPKARWHEWEAVSLDEEREGTRVAFGAPHRPVFQLDKADVVLCLDCDLLNGHPAAVAHARAFAARRNPDAGAMNRLYAIESNYSVTGANADHRLPLRSSLIGALVAALQAEMGVEGSMGASTIMGSARIAKFVTAVAKDLVAHKGKSLVAIGSHQPAAVQAQVHKINEWLSNVGVTVAYVPDADAERPPHAVDLKQLAADMNAGAVDTLVILGANPVYDAPADLEFGKALAKVANTIHLGVYRDETGEACSWHVPMAHYLETWGDARAWDGSIVVVQPTIAPLFGGKSPLELVALVAGDDLSDGYDIVRRTFDGLVGKDEMLWRRTLHDGLAAGSAPAPQALKVRPGLPPMPPAGNPNDRVENGDLELNFVADTKVYDGRFANNGWLQELPDYLTKLTWDNAALLSKATADQLGVGHNTLIDLSIGGRTLRVAAYVLPGHAQGAVTLALGYGRKAAGPVGGSAKGEIVTVGFDANQLRSSDALWFARGLKVESTGTAYDFALTQDHHEMDAVGMKGRAERVELLIKEASAEHYRENPDFVHADEHGPELKSLWDPPHVYDGHKWGLAVDLTKCTGCNACVIACQAENNIPIVGKTMVRRNREMHWMRIDRYFAGDVEEAEVVSQPVMCQQCENAPCESVCPVGATMHTKEGLNDMVYNRCVGTRYCSNNCPYKVRRFNFFNYHLDLNEPENAVLKMAYNPEVTVRARGVMEKCTYCVQRISAVRIAAKNAKRPMVDGEIVTACQQSCPAQAITFGDLADASAQVSKEHASRRRYDLLGMLNTKPRTVYLARIKNPNPALA